MKFVLWALLTFAVLAAVAQAAKVKTDTNTRDWSKMSDAEIDALDEGPFSFFLCFLLLLRRLFFRRLEWRRCTNRSRVG